MNATGPPIVIGYVRVYDNNNIILTIVITSRQWSGRSNDIILRWLLCNTSRLRQSTSSHENQIPSLGMLSSDIK